MDTVIMRALDVVQVFPFIVIVVAIVAALLAMVITGVGLSPIGDGLSDVMWPGAR